MSVKNIYTIERLDNYCKENNVVLTKDYSNEKIWCEMPLEGKCTNSDCINTFKKLFKGLIKNGSFCRQCAKCKTEKCINYNLKLLQSYCSEKNIKLDKDYSNEKLGVNTKIIGICKNDNCTNNFDYEFRILIRKEIPLCKKCSCITKVNKTKNTCLEKYGVESIAQVPEFRQKSEESMLKKYGVKYSSQSKELYNKQKKNNMEKYGVEYISQIPEIIQKVKNTNKEKYGVECSLQREEIKEKSKNTIVQKYGVEFISQVPEIRQKAKETTLERFGVEYATQCKEIQEKTKNTCLEKYGSERPSQNEEVKKKICSTNIIRYGVEYATQCKEIQEKTRITCLEKYGFESPLQNEEVKKKICSTNIIRYGVEHPAQNTEIMDKCSKNAYKLKEYTLPSGNIIKIQGYENYALDEILQDGILEEDIINGCKNVPEIWYEDENGIKHRHYVDIFIPNQKRCIEIKSTWTAEKKKDCIFLKQQAGKELGYNYEIWVYNGKGEKVECYK